MSCEEVRLQLPDYALGTLSEDEMSEVKRHLRGCAACRSEATTLDEGLSLFASAAHEADPPPELRDRVMAVLTEEWADAPRPQATRLRPRLVARWPALAAAVILITALTLAAVAQVNARGFRQDALSYRGFLQALGGKDVRVAKLLPATSIDMEGSAILYDSEQGQSWVMVLARAPGFTQEVKVRLEAPNGRFIDVRFPLSFGDDGDAWSGFVTSSDLSRFNRVVLIAPGGRVVATGTVQQQH
ncbi:MAG: zf-HC2 domain-containing protein [Actinomycetota bacterium]